MITFTQDRVLLMDIKFKFLSLLCAVSLLIPLIFSEARSNADIFDKSTTSGSYSYTGKTSVTAVPVGDSQQSGNLSYTPRYDYDTRSSRFHYLNADNIMINKNNVTVSPVEMYSDFTDGSDYRRQFYVHCRIYNGYDYEISDITVDWMEIHSGDTSILYKSNIKCENLTIQPHQSAIYTFTFDYVDIPYSVDLSDIEYEIYSHADVNRAEEESENEAPICDYLTPDPRNIYINNSKSNSDNSINLSVKKAYYKDDELILDCSMYNGYNFDLNNIRLNWANLYSNGELIAQGNIGIIYEDNIKEHGSVSCTIKFDYDLLVRYNAELIEPYFKYYYSYSY